MKPFVDIWLPPAARGRSAVLAGARLCRDRVRMILRGQGFSLSNAVRGRLGRGYGRSGGDPGRCTGPEARSLAATAGLILPCSRLPREAPIPGEWGWRCRRRVEPVGAETSAGDEAEQRPFPQLGVMGQLVYGGRCCWPAERL